MGLSRVAQLKFLLVLIAVLVLLRIGFQNRTEVDLRLLFWTVRMSGTLLYFLLFGAGVVCGMVLSWMLRSEKKPKSGDL